MTKNEDVSWIPKPVGCSLKRFSTDELVAELKGRHELCPVVDEMTREPVCLFVMTTESLVKELRKRRVVCKGCFGREFWNTMMNGRVNK